MNAKFVCIFCVIGLVNMSFGGAEEATVLFDGKHLDHWEFGEGAWAINDDGVLYCNMETVTAKNGTTRTRGMGYIWTKQDYENFELSFSYKLSEGANSGVFFRTDKDNPVQGGFEIQLMDDEGFQKSHGKKDGKNLNGAFYDAQAASSDPAKPAGQWNQMTVKCQGPNIQISINGVVVNKVDVDRWDTANKNPDGTPNKFKTPLKELPRTGRIGFQNHGQVAWFKDVKIRTF
jgi:hypothetical protein